MVKTIFSGVIKELSYFAKPWKEIDERIVFLHLKHRPYKYYIDTQLLYISEVQNPRYEDFLNVNNFYTEGNQ